MSANDCVTICEQMIVLLCEQRSVLLCEQMIVIDTM